MPLSIRDQNCGTKALRPRHHDSCLRRDSLNRAACREKPRKEAGAVFWNIPCPGSPALPSSHVPGKSCFYLVVGFQRLQPKILDRTCRRGFSLGASPAPLGDPVPLWGRVSVASAAPRLRCDFAGTSPGFRAESENHRAALTSSWPRVGQRDDGCFSCGGSRPIHSRSVSQARVRPTR